MSDYSPTTVREAVLWATERLRARTDEARLEAELLLGHALSLTRSQVLALFPKPLSAADWERCRLLVEERLSGRPLAYLVGHKEFFGLDFVVDGRVLVPRPETELLVERALALTSGTPPDGARWLIADVGTGSGAIAVSVAVHRPSALVYAIDISPEALEVAALNASQHGVSDRVVLLRGDLLEPLPLPVPLIAANLPYIGDLEWRDLATEVADHEPRSALYGGADGLDYYRRLLEQIPGRLLSSGHLLLEIDPAQAATLLKLVTHHPGTGAAVTIWRDFAGRERVVEIGC